MPGNVKRVGLHQRRPGVLEGILGAAAFKPLAGEVLMVVPHGKTVVIVELKIALNEVHILILGSVPALSFVPEDL